MVVKQNAGKIQNSRPLGYPKGLEPCLQSTVLPCTMYVDKPMRGHGLMQAIARVNRVFHDKPGGLVVDYIGLGADLKAALGDYTNNGGKGRPGFDQAKAVALMKDKYEIVLAMFHGFDLSGAVSAPQAMWPSGRGGRGESKYIENAD